MGILVYKDAFRDSSRFFYKRGREGGREGLVNRVTSQVFLEFDHCLELFRPLLTSLTANIDTSISTRYFYIDTRRGAFRYVYHFDDTVHMLHHMIHHMILHMTHHMKLFQ